MEHLERRVLFILIPHSVIRSCTDIHLPASCGNTQLICFYLCLQFCVTLPVRGTLDLTPITVVGCLPNAHLPADLRYPDIVSVLKMSDLYGVSLDYLLKGDSPMKNYLDYIEESTNVVKSKVKLSKLILILSYLVIWAFNIMVSWFFSAESISEAQAGAFQWLVLPVATIVISLPFFIIQLSGSRSFPLTSCAFSALFLSRCSIASCFHTFPHLRLSEATQNPCPLCRLSSYRGTR